MCANHSVPTIDYNIPPYPIFTTPTKENYCSINLAVPNANLGTTPKNHKIYDDNYYSSSTIKNFPQNFKQVIFNIEKAQYESSSDSSMTPYLKSNYNTQHIINQTQNLNLKIIPSTPAKKNLFSVFENAVKSQQHLITPININKKKNLFECSASSTFFTTSTKKKRRFRKNKEQIEKLNLFYSGKNTRWSREQIKKISEEIGIKDIIILLYINVSLNKRINDLLITNQNELIYVVLERLSRYVISI